MQQQIVLAMSMVISSLLCFAVAQDKAQSISSEKAAKSFTLHILNEDWNSLDLRYSLETAWPILKNVYRHNTVAEVTDRDITKYDWVRQQVTLTTDASQALKTKFKIGVNNTLSLNFGTPHRAFVAVVNGKPQYGGVFLELGSAMGVRYPVIYINEDKNGLITMDIRPVHSINELDTSDPIWKIVRQDCIHDIFAREGKLVP